MAGLNIFIAILVVSRERRLDNDSIIQGCIPFPVEEIFDSDSIIEIITPLFLKGVKELLRTRSQDRIISVGFITMSLIFPEKIIISKRKGSSEKQVRALVEGKTQEESDIRIAAWLTGLMTEVFKDLEVQQLLIPFEGITEVEAG